jgi:hypothetical protein
MRSSGQATAMMAAWLVIQEECAPIGSPKSWRAAVAVDDSGFHTAMAPSHAGMVETATNGLPRKPIGNSRVRMAVTASGWW